MGNILSALLSFLTSETGLSLLAWVVGAIFSAIFSADKVKAWLTEAKIEKLKKSLSYLETAVIENKGLVDKMKEENGGKLSEEQKSILEEKVVKSLKDASSKIGVDMLKILGPEMIKPAITYTVKKLKGNVDLPPNVIDLFK